MGDCDGAHDRGRGGLGGYHQRGQDGGGGLHGAVVRPVPDDRPQIRGVLPDLHGPPLFKVDVDDCDSVAAKAGISAMPTFQVYKAGQKVDEIVGASPEKLEALIKAALTKWGGRGSFPPPPAAAPA